MAREPYRTRMYDALTSGTPEEQDEKLLLFLIEEAGSSHSDVVAALNAESIERDVAKKYHPMFQWRYFISTKKYGVVTVEFTAPNNVEARKLGHLALQALCPDEFEISRVYGQRLGKV